MAERNSKDLLHLEANSAKSKLLVCEKDKPFSLPEAPLEKPTMLPLPKSQVLEKVKDFLGVISESNKKLIQEATKNPDSYDIEVLSGKESEYIEMDLMLGVADLHTPEAVAAAESAMAGYQVVGVALSEDEDEGNEENTINEQQDNGSEGDSSCKKSRKRKYKLEKQPKKSRYASRVKQAARLAYVYASEANTIFPIRESRMSRSTTRVCLRE